MKATLKMQSSSDILILSSVGFFMLLVHILPTFSNSCQKNKIYVTLIALGKVAASGFLHDLKSSLRAGGIFVDHKCLDKNLEILKTWENTSLLHHGQGVNLFYTMNTEAQA